MRFAGEQEVLQELAWVLDAAGMPAFFLVFAQDPASMGRALADQFGEKGPVSRIQAHGIEWIEAVGQPGASPTWIIEGAISSVRPAERQAINVARSQLLEAGRHVVLVEPASTLTDVFHEDLRDFRHVVREIFQTRPPVYEDDHLADTGNAWRLRSIAARLPAVVTSGGTIIQGGKVHFKQVPVITCPRCGETLRPGTTTLVFRHAPPAQREQRVAGWVCPCGEAYVSGKTARDAHAAAFRSDPEGPPGSRDPNQP